MSTVIGAVVVSVPVLQWEDRYVIKKTRCPFASTVLLVEWDGNSTGKHKDYIDLCVFWVPVAPGSSLGACLCGGWRRGWVVTQIDNGCTVCGW